MEINLPFLSCNGDTFRRLPPIVICNIDFIGCSDHKGTIHSK